jgi:hypothetical protein
VTSQESPNDLDVLLMVASDFDLEGSPEECKVLWFFRSFGEACPRVVCGVYGWESLAASVFEPRWRFETRWPLCCRTPSPSAWRRVPSTTRPPSFPC